eukprot:9099980-Heterocapsa_arctica.AAC.2
MNVKQIVRLRLALRSSPCADAETSSGLAHLSALLERFRALRASSPAEGPSEDQMIACFDVT